MFLHFRCSMQLLREQMLGFAVFDLGAVKHVFKLIITGGVSSAAAAADASDDALDSAAAVATAESVEQTADSTISTTAATAAASSAALRELSPKGFSAFRSFFRLINRGSRALRVCGTGSSSTAYVHYGSGSSSSSSGGGAALPNMLVTVAPGALVGMRQVWQLALYATSTAVSQGNGSYNCVKLVVFAEQ
jgi:hypothetical protein